MHLPFEFDATFLFVGRAFGITPSSTWVEVDDDRFEARFGPWRVRTPVDNIEATSVTGPYSIPKTIGPAHLSLRDRGLTFATNRRRGVCISFRTPVAGIDPLGVLRHPALTVTVRDPDALVEALRSDAPPIDLDEAEQEQAAEDQLHTMTARELRELADERGVAHTSSMSKARLVELLEAQLDDELVEELAGP